MPTEADEPVAAGMPTRAPAGTAVRSLRDPRQVKEPRAGSATAGRRERGAAAAAPPAPTRIARRRRASASSRRRRSLTWTVTSGSPARDRIADLLVEDEAHRGIDPAVDRLPPGAEEHRRVADGAAGDARSRARRASARSSTVSARAGQARRVVAHRADRRPAARSPPGTSRSPAPEASASRTRARAASRPLARRRPGRASRPPAPRRATPGPAGPRPFRVSIALHDLERVADRAAQRLLHVRDEGDHLLAHAAADRDHGLGQRPRVLVLDFMNAPSPVLTSSTSASMPSAIFLLMMEAAMRGRLSTVARHVAQRVELAVGGRDLRRLADEAQPASCAARRGTRRARGRRGSRGSTPACPACRRCGRGRGPRSSARTRRRPRPAGRGRGWSCRPRRPSSACRPWGRAGRRGRAPRPSASSTRVRATVSAAVMPRKKTAMASAEAW